MTVIENAQLKATIRHRGAELVSLFNKDHQLEYMWKGDPAYWAKHSPVLFPIVGSLKENVYYINNTAYQMARHGFARDSKFTEERKESDRVDFLLVSSSETKKNYPFAFEFRIHYSLHDNQLSVGYSITNKGKEDMYFSVGGHPAFAIPLSENTHYTDYYLEFEKNETAARWPISAAGLIKTESLPFLQDAGKLPLSKDLFFEDAIVLKNLSSSFICLKSGSTPHGWKFDFTDFPYLGIWAVRNADFVCIEPWCGIADSTDSDQQLIHKEGINRLPPTGIFSRVWTVELW